MEDNSAFIIIELPGNTESSDIRRDKDDKHTEKGYPDS